MIQFLMFAVIYGILMFIGSFVYLNKSNDKVNQSFLYFLSLVILWMALSVGSGYDSDSRAFELALKTVYWLSMMNLAVLFLLFVYRLVQKKLDAVFYFFVGLNTLTILERYLFPMDYADPAFWRLSLPVVAPLMSAIFSLPAVYALFLVVRHYMLTKDQRQKVQMQYVFAGVGLAGAISVVSEYVLPAVFHIQTGFSLMYIAILVFVAFLFVSIMKFKLMNMQAEYIYRKLLLNASEGILLINKHRRIICINDAAKEVLQNDGISAGDKIADLIQGYAFEENYRLQEMAVRTVGGEIHIAVTQYPVEPKDRGSVKIMTIADVTSHRREKERLVEKSSTDPLTGFFNKQYYIEHCISRPEQGRAELSVLFADVDNFKGINDQYGHLAGDKVLKALAECISNHIPSGSRAVRFGGDEFVVLLENTSANNACRVAEQIRGGVCAIDFADYAPGLVLSLSIGVANGLLLGTDSVDSLIQNADAAMYRSKSGGKNRVVLFTE